MSRCIFKLRYLYEMFVFRCTCGSIKTCYLWADYIKPASQLLLVAVWGLVGAGLGAVNPVESDTDS